MFGQAKTPGRFEFEYSDFEFVSDFGFRASCLPFVAAVHLEYAFIMNTRLLRIVIGVQALFAIALIVAGLSARDGRRVEYLELTRRVTSGQAAIEDFTKLAARIPAEAGALAVRALFGPPLQRAAQIEVGQTNPERRTGEFWLYYPCDDKGYPVDYEALAKFHGAVQCFVVSFDAKGHVRADLLWVQHPVQ